MRTLYIEDLASHGGPESCVGVPRGRSEALAGVRAGWAIEPRNDMVWGADALITAEGNTAGGANASRWGALRGRRTWARTESSCARTGRSHGRPLLVVDAPSYGFAGWHVGWWAGRRGNAEAVIP
jgi:hypothetical protein